MSKKNLSQSITDAWKTAVKTGQQLNENKKKREQEVSKIFDSARTDVIQHVLENDHGFYRPDVDPFFAEVDGGMLQRKRLIEQEGTDTGATDTGATDTGADDAAAKAAEEEKKKKEEEARKKREELQAKKAIDSGPKAQQTQTGQTITNRSETGIAALDQKPKATPGSEEYSKRGGSARDAETRGAIDDLDIGAGEKQDRKDILSRAQADPDERKRLENMSDEEMRDELNSKQLARIKAARLERDKDKIASGDMDAEGKLTGQGAQKRMDNQDAAQKRRLSIIDQKIAQTEALMAGLSGKDLARAKRRLSQHRAEKIGIEGGAERRRMQLQGLIDRDKPADTPAAGGAAADSSSTSTQADAMAQGDAVVSDGEGTLGGEIESGAVQNPNSPNPELAGTAGDKVGVGTREGSGVVSDVVAPATPETIDAIEQGIEAIPFSIPGMTDDSGKAVKLPGVEIGGGRGDDRYKELQVSNSDESGVSYVRQFDDGRKEVAYTSGEIVKYDAEGNTATGDDAAVQRPALAAKQRQRAVKDALGDQGVSELEQLNKQLSDDSFRRDSVRQGAGAQATAGMTRLTDTQRAEINAKLKALADKAGMSVDQLQADFEGKIDRPEDPEPVAGGSGDATVNTPPASVAPQPAKSPPRPRQSDREGNLIPLPGELQLNQSYNPVSKYGVKLFEARKRFK